MQRAISHVMASSRLKIVGAVLLLLAFFFFLTMLIDKSI